MKLRNYKFPTPPLPPQPITSPIRRSMPSPSKEEIESELFEVIFDLIKDWDINVSEYYSGYAGGNGSHVKLILDKINPVIMIVISKKQTDNLTRGKSYKVLEVEASRYRIVSDRNKIITTSFDNFYNIDEFRDLTINNILNEE